MVQITVYKKTVSALPGDRISFRAKLFPLNSFKIPGAFNYSQFLNNHGITATGYTKDPVAPTSTTERFFWNRIRQNISNWISKHVPIKNQGLVEALLVGKRGRLDQITVEALTVSGTFHLVAISGLHLGLVAGWSFFLIRILITLIPALSLNYDSKRPAALLAILPMLIYASLAGWSISTQRASLMIGLYLLAVALGRSRHGWRALSLAAIILLLWHPYELFQAGFQLSFIAVAGLLALWPHNDKPQGWRGKIIALLVVTMFMQVVTLPVVMHHFHRLTPYGFTGNLLAVPWVSLVSAPLGILALLGKLIHPDLGEWFLQAMSLSLEQLRDWTGWIAQLPGAWHRTSGPSLPGLGLFVAGIAWAAMVQIRWQRFGIALLAVAALLLPRAAPVAEGWLHMAVLDVGQAQSVAFKAPSGGWSIIDAGGAVTPRFNIGESAISAYLWQHGVEKLDRIIISHPQSDHMAGAKRLLRNFTVKSLWLGEFSKEEKHKR